jgi:hypothetical protein
MARHNAKGETTGVISTLARRDDNDNRQKRERKERIEYKFARALSKFVE